MNVISSQIRIEKIGNATLYLADCREILPTIIADAVVTDPPYGIRHVAKKGISAIKGAASWAGREIAGDQNTAARDEIVNWLAGRPGAFCGSWKASAPAETRFPVIWDKGPAFGMGDFTFPWKPSWEFVFVVGDGWQGRRDGGVLRGPSVPTSEAAGRSHPHEKPVWLMSHFIEKLPQARVVFDPFMGSGTTGVAAVTLNRQFVGCEIDTRYFDIACRRIDEAQRQVDLFITGMSDATGATKGHL